jgi:hypothetical protein
VSLSHHTLCLFSLQSSFVVIGSPSSPDLSEIQGVNPANRGRAPGHGDTQVSPKQIVHGSPTAIIGWGVVLGRQGPGRRRGGRIAPEGGRDAAPSAMRTGRADGLDQIVRECLGSCRCRGKEDWGPGWRGPHSHGSGWADALQKSVMPPKGQRRLRPGGRPRRLPG